METKRTYEEIKQLYPDEWVLILDPVFDGLHVTEGVPLAHHPDKRTAMELSKMELAKIPKFEITFVFTGKLKPINRSWIHSTRLNSTKNPQ